MKYNDLEDAQGRCTANMTRSLLANNSSTVGVSRVHHGYPLGNHLLDQNQLYCICNDAEDALLGLDEQHGCMWLGIVLVNSQLHLKTCVNFTRCTLDGLGTL